MPGEENWANDHHKWRRYDVVVPSLYDASRAEIAEVLGNVPAYRTDQVWEALYQRFATPEEMTNLPSALRARLATQLPSSLEVLSTAIAGDGATTKWLLGAPGDAVLEMVLMAYDARVTVCLSSQAGCAMGCSFCATGQAGFKRHLTTGEIVEQFVLAARAAHPRRLSNVVFMGMGEPLANFANLYAAIERLHGDIGLSARSITVSTVGVVPGIAKLAAAELPVNLAVSLHAANDELRSELVPLNRRYPLATLAQACHAYFEATHRRISLEWALIDGLNDDDKSADELSAFALPLKAHVNLIPLNPTPGYLVQGTSSEGVRAFAAALRARGVNATIRDTRGRDIDAACGQLAAMSPGARPAPVAIVGPAQRRPSR